MSSGMDMRNFTGEPVSPDPTSTEPKRGTCGWTGKIDVNYDTSVHQKPHLKYHSCIDWREGESAPAQPCRECVTHVIAGASWIPCALPKGHEGGHRGKGTCVKHGEYFGEFGAFPQCPQWPDCIADGIGHVTRGDVRKWLSGDHSECEAVPPAAETAPKCEHCNDPGWLPETELLVAEPCDCRAGTAMTAEQFYDANKQFEHVPSIARKHFFEFAEAYAAHVREAARGESMTAEQLATDILTNHMDNFLGPNPVAAGRKVKKLAERIEAYGAHVREAAQSNAAVNRELSDLREKWNASERKLARYEALDAHLPPLYAIGDDATAELAVELVEVERKLAELDKALQSALFPLAVLVQSGECVAAATALNEELKLQILTAHDDVYAALASLRAESKEPVD